MKRKFKINLSEKNKAFGFLLPIFVDELNLKFLGKIEGFYTGNKKIDDGEYCFLYEFSAKPEFLEYEAELAKNEHYIGHEDFDQYVLYKFKLPNNLEATVKLFKSGKYSLFSSKHQDLVVKMFGKKPKSIFNKDSELRKKLEKELKVKISLDAELSSVPKEETLVFANHVTELNLETENTIDKYE